MSSTMPSGIQVARADKRPANSRGGINVHKAPAEDVIASWSPRSSAVFEHPANRERRASPRLYVRGLNLPKSNAAQPGNVQRGHRTVIQRVGMSVELRDRSGDSRIRDQVVTIGPLETGNHGNQEVVQQVGGECRAADQCCWR